MGFGLMALFLPLAMAQAVTPKAQLKEYMAELSGSPDNQELRIKIIQLVAKMKPKPAVPDEVKTLMDQAYNAISDETGPGAYLNAIDAYQKASLLAPWAGNIYFNLGVVQKSAGKFAEALGNYNLYLVAYPNLKDKQQVQSDMMFIESYFPSKSQAASFLGEWVWEEPYCDINKLHLLIRQNSDGTLSAEFVDDPNGWSGCWKDVHPWAKNYIFSPVSVAGPYITFEATYVGPLKTGVDRSYNGYYEFNMTLESEGALSITAFKLNHPVGSGFPDVPLVVKIYYHRIH